MHISSNRAALQQAVKDTEPVEGPHRCFSTPTGTEEEDRVIAGLRDGAGDKVLQLAAQHKGGRLAKCFQQAMRAEWVPIRLTCNWYQRRT
jgi:hypothetical protein